MAAASPGNVPAIFDLRSASLTLVSLVLKSTDIVAIAHELEERFGKGFNPFDGDPVVVDLAAVADSTQQVDFVELAQLLRAHKMQPIAVKGGSAEHKEQALAAGLTEAPETPPARSSTVERPKTAQGPSSEGATAVSAGQTAASREESAPKPVAMAEVGTLVVDRPLRSGQQIYARGGDLVVLAVVNAGAEVIADGNIHVYAPLRGRAIAGARGNAGARIFSTNMEPQLVSIAGTYRTTETALPDDVLGKPAQVRLDGERLVIEALKL